MVPGASIAVIDSGAVVLIGFAVTWFAPRRRQSWASWAVLATLLCYGLSMTLEAGTMLAERIGDRDG